VAHTKRDSPGAARDAASVHFRPEYCEDGHICLYIWFVDYVAFLLQIFVDYVAK